MIRHRLLIRAETEEGIAALKKHFIDSQGQFGAWFLLHSRSSGFSMTVRFDDPELTINQVAENMQIAQIEVVSVTPIQPLETEELPSFSPEIIEFPSGEPFSPESIMP